MARARKRVRAVIVWVLAALGIAAAAWWGVQAKKTEMIRPAAYHGPISNPMTGYAPCADYYEIVGDSQLVYVDFTWSEWEPTEGRYDYTAVEQSNHLDEWRAKGKHVVFRFLCDVPGSKKHMDIPQWLYDQMNGDGSWYDTDYGLGFSPNYANPIMIEKHRRAIEALGQRYGKDDFFCYIELGSLGHWGEWHTKHDSGIAPLPKEDVRNQYIQPYVESFPNALLMMRRPFGAAKQYGMGLYNDMTGEPSSTSEWHQWIDAGGVYGETGEEGGLVPMPDAWQTAPFGGEFTSDVPMKQMLTSDLKQTIGLIKESHMTFIGPKCPLLPEDREYSEGVQAALSELGSRLRIGRVVLQQSLLFPGDLSVQLDWVNDGSAPFYRNWQAMLYLLDQSGATVLSSPVDVDIRKVTGSAPVASVTAMPVGQLPPGNYSLGLAILDPETGNPAYSFAMEGMGPDHVCVIGQWKKD